MRERKTQVLISDHDSTNYDFLNLIVRKQSVWILTRDRQPSDTIINLAKQALEDNNVDEASLNMFKMRQDDDCVNDKDDSCSEDEANLRPKED